MAVSYVRCQFSPSAFMIFSLVLAFSSLIGVCLFLVSLFWSVMDFIDLLVWIKVLLKFWKFSSIFFFQYILSVAQMIKTLSAMCETWVWSQGQEDPLKKGMATHSSILPWRISRTDEPGGLLSMGSQKMGNGLATNTFTVTHF